MPRKKEPDHDSFEGVLKDLRRGFKEDRKKVKEKKKELKRQVRQLQKQDPKIKEKLLEGFIVFPPQERGPRRKKEIILTNAETQKRHREKMKDAGYRKIWVKGDEKLKSEEEFVAVKLHQSSLGIAKREPNIKIFLAKFLEIAASHAEQNLHSWDFVDDLAEFFKTLGLESPADAIEEIEQILKDAQETACMEPAAKISK